MAAFIETSRSLKSLNTFGIDVKASYYTAVKNRGDLIELLSGNRPELSEFLILGCGSNILFTGDFDGCVIHMFNKGIDVEREDSDHIYVRAAAGEVWDDFVEYCLARNLGGVENLIAIPGSVGAAPVQNIGAYGVEVGETVEEVEAVLAENGSRITIPAPECDFGYRSSIFKTTLKGQVVITSVLFRVRKKPVINVGYGDVKSSLLDAGISEPSVRDVANVIRGIRESKLPDHKVMGNAGSFFKNPVISEEECSHLLSKYPEMPVFPQPGGMVKLAAGWLVEKSGLKGVRMGNAAIHDKQALVLINKGDATGMEITTLANHIIKTVWLNFAVRLEPEVVIL